MVKKKPRGMTLGGLEKFLEDANQYYKDRGWLDEEKIDTSEIPELDDEWFKNAKLRKPDGK
jgi:hypothetical protein